MTKIFLPMSILTAIAMLLPVFSGYVLALVMLIWQAINFSKQRTAANIITTPNPLKIWTLPILVLLTSIILASLATLSPSTSESRSEVMRFLGNTAIKYVVLWFSMQGFIWAAVFKHNFKANMASALGPIAGANFTYCLIQRYTGIDWAHGVQAVLPQNRFSYGVYRVSGFTSHPLTLGYQLCLFTVLALSLAFAKDLKSTQRASALAGATFSLLTILISGSRGPQIVVVLSVGLILKPYIKGLIRKVLIPTILLLGVIAMRIGFFERFKELSSLKFGDTRMTDWMVYCRAFLDHPWFGLGVGNFKSAISPYYSQFGGDATIGLAHNFLLQVGAESGIVGVAGFTYWVLTWPRYARRIIDPSERRNFLVLFFVIFSSSLTQNSLKDSGVLYSLTIATMVLASSYYSNISRESDEPNRRPQKNKGQQS
ncbi:MAG: O-antigen ligase family protein [Proteobacteria bacterium]|nr:O-antigen ligase family protein [Pseudomonadota bacterium]